MTRRALRVKGKGAYQRDNGMSIEEHAMQRVFPRRPDNDNPRETRLVIDNLHQKVLFCFHIASISVDIDLNKSTLLPKCGSLFSK